MANDNMQVVRVTAYLFAKLPIIFLIWNGSLYVYTDISLKDIYVPGLTLSIYNSDIWVALFIY